VIHGVTKSQTRLSNWTELNSKYPHKLSQLVSDTQYFILFSRLTPILWLTANIPREEKKKKLSHRERKRTQEHNSKDIVESIPQSHKWKEWQHIRESDITQGRRITKLLFWHHISVLVKPFLYFQYSYWIFSKFDSLCTAENIYKPHFFQLLIK